MDADHPALVAAARHGLVSRRPPVTLTTADFSRVAALARHDHLSGFLAAAVADGAVAVDQGDELLLTAQWHEELVACVVVEALAVRATATLDAASVRWRLTKGAAIAHLDYPDPAVRTFGDVDLIIHPDDWITAVDGLLDNGYQREAATLPGDFDRRYGKGVTLTTDQGLELDLHRRLAIGRFGVSSRMEELFESSDHVVLADRALATPIKTHRLLHACFHASLGGFRRLRAFRDVAQLILVAEADWKATFAVAEGWRAEAVVVSAITETWRRLQLAPTHPAYLFAVDVHLSRADKRTLTLFEQERSWSAQALTALPRLSVRESSAYLTSLGTHWLQHRRAKSPTL